MRQIAATTRRLLALMTLPWVAVLLCLPRTAPAQGAPPPLRVALLDFTSDDGFLRSAGAASDMTGLVQAELATEPGVVWVERTQLRSAVREQELGAGGFTSGASALRLGKLLHADLAIVGRFTRNEKNNEGHTLLLEVVDLRRADTLASRSLHIEGDRRDPIVSSPEKLRWTVAAAREALAEARKRLAAGVRAKTLGVLFFQNVDPSPRLDRYGEELNGALARAAEVRAGTLRAVRFPRAFDALGEAELSVLGLSDGDPEAWRRVADQYVWGSYHELASAGVPFEQVRVEVTLTLWDGHGPPRQIVETAPVAELSALSQRLAGQVCRMASAAPPDAPPPADGARDEVAAWLMARATELAASVDEHGRGESRERAAFLATAQGQALVRQQSRLLEIACFFAPLNRPAQLARLGMRWPGFPLTAERLPFLRAWQRANELDAFAGTFGGGRDWSLRQAQVNAAAGLLTGLDSGERSLGETFGDHLLPIDTTKENLADWRGQLEAHFAALADRYARDAVGDNAARAATASPAREWIDVAVRFFRDRKTAAALVETLWPFQADEYRRERSNTRRGNSGLAHERAKAIRELFASLGQPARGAGLLDAPEPSAAPPVATRDSSRRPAFVPAVRAAAPPVGIFRPPLPPGMDRLRPGWRRVVIPSPPLDRFAGMIAPFPADEHPVRMTGTRPPLRRGTVCDLATGNDDAVWIATDYQVREQGRTVADHSVWRFDPARDALSEMTAPLGLDPRTPLASLLVSGDALWLTPTLGGVWQADARDARVSRKFTVEDGLLDMTLVAAAAGPDGSLYFGGSHQGHRLVNVLDGPTHTWRRVETRIDAPASISANIGVWRHWLLAGPGPWVLHDLETGRSESLSARIGEATGLPMADAPRASARPPGALPPPGESAPAVHRKLCVADKNGFWLAVGSRLLFLDPQSGQVRAVGALTMSISALLLDGDDLWVVCSPPETAALTDRFTDREEPAEYSTVAILHKPAGVWRGGFDLKGRVTCATGARRAVYLGIQDEGNALIEVDKASLSPER